MSLEGGMPEAVGPARKMGGGNEQQTLASREISVWLPPERERERERERDVENIAKRNKKII